jgi:hypothetical protein
MRDETLKKRRSTDETSEGIEGLREKDASGLDGKEKRVAGAEADARETTYQSQLRYEV